MAKSKLIPIVDNCHILDGLFSSVVMDNNFTYNACTGTCYSLYTQKIKRVDFVDEFCSVTPVLLLKPRRIRKQYMFIYWDYFYVCRYL